MIIEINTESLVNLRITPDEYLYLYLLHHKAYDILDTLNLNVAYEDLQTKGYIKLGQDVQSHVVRPAFTETFSTPFLQMWHGLLSHFPLKVNSKTGVRVLRAKDAMAKANEKARQANDHRRDHSTKTDPAVRLGCRDIAVKNLAGGFQAHAV